MLSRGRRSGDMDAARTTGRLETSRSPGVYKLAAALVLLASCAQATTRAGTNTPGVGPAPSAAPTPSAAPSPAGAPSVEATAASSPTPGFATPAAARATAATTSTAAPEASPTLPARRATRVATPSAGVAASAAPLAPRARAGAPVVLQPGTRSIVILTQPVAGQGAPALPLRPVWTKRLAAGALAAGVRIPAGQAQGPLEILAQDGGDAAKETVQIAPAVALAQGFGSPDDVTVGPDGTIVFSDFGNQGVNALIPGGRPEALVTGIKEPEGVAVARDGSVVVADQQRNAALRLDPVTRRVATIATIRNLTGSPGVDGIALDPDTGEILFPDSPNGRLLRISPDGKSVAPLPGRYVRPVGVAKLPGGGYLVADEYGGRVYKIDAAGRVATMGGAFASPDDVALDAAGDVLVNSLGDGTIKAIAPDGRATTLLSGFRNPQGLAVDQADNVIVVDTDRNRLVRLVRTFAVDPPAADPIALPATIPLTITRALGYSGTVAWRVISTPPGVTAKIDADPATPDLALLSLSGTAGPHGRILVEATSSQWRSVAQIALESP